MGTLRCWQGIGIEMLELAWRSVCELNAREGACIRNRIDVLVKFHFHGVKSKKYDMYLAVRGDSGLLKSNCYVEWYEIEKWLPGVIEPQL